MAYTVLPTVLARFCSLGAISKVPVKGRVFITFDDGPDPRYTPRVLEILRSAGVKACFFVIGEKARRHPEIVRKIQGDGHQVGNHGLRHRMPWLLGPVETVREIRESFQVIKEITGSPPAAFRPPWGLFNLFSFISRFLIGQKIVLWSFMSWDWTSGATTGDIERKVREKVADGSILIFHDSDTEPGASTGSPEKMISALPGIISELKSRGFEAALLEDPAAIPRPPEGRLKKIWRLWEKVFSLALGISDVTSGDGRPTVFRIAARRYRGPRVELPGGEVLDPGQKVCELHVNNDYLEKILAGETSPGRIGVRIARELVRSLPSLARRLAVDQLFSEARFVVGITMLHRGSVSAGFTPVEIPSPGIRKMISIYQGILLRLYHPSGRGRLRGAGDLSPKILVMSRSYLFSRYL